MAHWGCAIRGCKRVFDDPESLLAHQMADHDLHECHICGEQVPAGFFAIQHVFDEHNRAAYVRHYDADADAIRWREHIKDTIEARADLSAIEDHLSSDAGDVIAVEAKD
ncbi:MAG: hypothetical protein ABEJ58_10625 [Halodesulfurarchaeum sp.]